jgi:diketogulonate reductase-like aldo/keto reductase
VWPKDLNPDQLLEKLLQFINTSCWEYIDILLVHAPIDVANRFEQWKALETLKKQNLVKIIGNSNLSINELMTVMKNSEILPSIHSVSMLKLHILRCIYIYFLVSIDGSQPLFSTT